MKLLLDENLSRRLIPFLQTAYPGNTQVVLEGLERASDRDIWQYAKDHDFVIVTKDADYYDLSLLLGAPPFVIWLQTGNSDKAAVLTCLIESRAEIQAGLENGQQCVEVFA
jgi:predicted nuclease of predicted toxin-antitoxin system